MNKKVELIFPQSIETEKNESFEKFLSVLAEIIVIHIGSLQNSK